jgi:hypothetical protein
VRIGGDKPVKTLYYKLINTYFKRRRVVLLGRSLNRGSKRLKLILLDLITRQVIPCSFITLKV